jgi:transposase
MWVPPEDKDPILLHAPTRKSVALFGAVNLRNGQLVHMLAPTFDAITFTTFLLLLQTHQSKNRDMTIILDNARYHHSSISRVLPESLGIHMRLEFLPPYSPELNPIERVWKLTRRLCTHNRYFHDLDELTKVVSRQLSLWGKPNDILAKLCCIY